MHDRRQSTSFSAAALSTPAMRITRSVSVAGWNERASHRACRFLAAQRQDRLPEPQLLGFLEALLRMRNRPDGARKADFAEIDAIGGKGKSGERRNQGRRNGKIGRRLGDAVAAGDVEIDVVRGEAHAAMGLEHREHHGEARLVPADDGAARRAERRGRDQRLDLDQHRPRALHAGEDGGARRLGVALAEEELGWVGDLAQALVRHLEDADLVGRAEAVLHRAQDAEMVAAFALEIEHGVDHVLDDARPGDLAFLGDVADEHDRGAGGFGVADDGLRRGAHLRDGAGRRIGKVGPQRLDRIEDDEVGPPAFGERGEDVLDIGFGGELDRSAGERRAAARAAGPARRPPRPRHRRRDGPSSASAAAACISSVDLPMPGSPPTRIAEPRTKPPPVARSSSAMPDAMRGASSISPDSEVSATARPLRGERRLCGPPPMPPRRAFLDERVPLAAGVAFARPARM